MRPSNPDARYVPRDPSGLQSGIPEKPREVGLGTMKIVVEEPEWAARLEAKLDQILAHLEGRAE